MTGATWYFAKNNQQQGPVTEDELKRLFVSAQLPADALVWCPSMANWTPANQVEVLAPAFVPAPAPAPAPTLQLPHGQAQEVFSSYRAPDAVLTSLSPEETFARELASAQVNPGENDRISRVEQQFASAAKSEPKPATAQNTGWGTADGSALPDWGQPAAPQATAEPAPKYDKDGFDVQHADFQMQMPAGYQSYEQPAPAPAPAPTAAPAPEPAAARASNESLSSEEQSARLREIVAQTAPPSAGKWGNLDSIPTPAAKGGASSVPASALDAIPTPGARAQQQTLQEEPQPVVRSGGLGDSGRLRALAEGTVDTGSFVKGTASHLNRRSFSGLPAAGPTTPPAPGELTTPRPWFRFWARCLDDSIYYLPGLALLGLFGPKSSTVPDAGALVGTLMSMFMLATVGFAIKLALEVVVLGRFGTSIGKRSFNIHLKDDTTGEPISMELAMKRTMWLTLFSGWFLKFIPVVGMFFAPPACGASCIWQYLELTKKGKSSWDEKCGIRYEHHPLDSKAKTMLICSVVVCALIQIIMVVAQIVKTISSVLPH